MRVGGRLGALAAIFAAVYAAACAPTVAAPPVRAGGASASATAVVAFPPLLGFGGPAERLRAARRMGDGLIEATGGHVILAEELPGRAPEIMAEGIRALGEDPRTTLTFSPSAVRTERLENIGLAGGAGAANAVRRFADYTVRVEVRRVDGPAVIGTVETFGSALANSPEVDGSGQPQGLQRAMDVAVREALARFAPRLVPARVPLPVFAELPAGLEQVPRSGAPALVERLRRLTALYPELSPDDLAKLATSRARVLVVKPGRLAALGVESGDLLGGMGGKTLGSRAALARSLARGDAPALSIERAGGRFLVGQPVKSPAPTPAHESP